MYKRISILLGIVFLLLLIPLIAMQFTPEVNWSVGDFVVMGCLLFCTGLGLDFAWRKMKTSPYRHLVLLGILILFLLVWAELAVGIFGTPWAGQ